MAKIYRVKTKAVFNGNPVGSTIELPEVTAKKYEANNYLEIIEEVKPKPKRKPAQKKPTKQAEAQKEDSTEK